MVNARQFLRPHGVRPGRTFSWYSVAFAQTLILKTPPALRTHCRAAIDICDDPECGYAWAKQDAEALLAP